MTARTRRVEYLAYCQHCGTDYTARKRGALYCSEECRWQVRIRRNGIPCSICGEPTATMKAGALRAPTHNTCARSRHGTVTSYKRGCRCDECRAAAAAEQRRYAATVKERDGVSLSRKYRRKGSEDQFISRADRFAIYERDRWTCQLCHAPVDPNLGASDRMAATLDHIIPRSLATTPDHSPANLQLAHRSCNSAKNNRALPDHNYQVS